MTKRNVYWQVTLYIVQYTLYIVHYILYIIHYTLYIVRVLAGDDPLGYEHSSERWSPVQSVEKILLSVISMLGWGSLCFFKRGRFGVVLTV